ncbi:hypothetical protein [Methanosarcina horonobensis]|uniref:hypothetical protein n=1 Tax=Methanosarcina horonobensis TaxID=418008 RepID=UPI001EF6C821|nr:hypothetical protein [Methanosarcina horonobensis]
MFHMTSNFVKISGFTLRGANSTYGIYLDGVSGSSINNNYFSEKLEKHHVKRFARELSEK